MVGTIRGSYFHKYFIARIWPCAGSKESRGGNKGYCIAPNRRIGEAQQVARKTSARIICGDCRPISECFYCIGISSFFWFYTKPALIGHDIPTAGNIADDYFFFLPLLLFLNLLLAIFNMIPAFPMDGGRILRALLSIKLGRLQATKFAMMIGQVIAIGLVIVGTWYGKFSYALIGMFISFTAVREYKWIKTEHLLTNCKVGDSYVGDFGKINLEDSIEKAISIFNEFGHRIFLVFDKAGTVVGTFLEKDEGVKGAQIKDLYHLCAESLDTEDSLKIANDRLVETGSDFLPVYENGNLVGILEEVLLWDFVAQQTKK